MKLTRTFAAVFLLPLSASALTEFDTFKARWGQINTIAGNGLRDDCNDWIPASHEGRVGTATDLSRPHMAAADTQGNVYIADKEAYAIRKVDAAGVITTVAGNGGFGVPVEGGQAAQQPLWAPNGLFVMADGSFYFLTVNDNCELDQVLPGGKIHKVTPAGVLTTVVDDATLAVGRGLYVSADESTITYCSGAEVRQWTQAGGISTMATGFVQLGNLDREAGGTFLVTDRFGYCVWRVAADGTKTVVAGNGTTSGGGHGFDATATGLNEVRGVVVLESGGYLVCTHRDSQVWMVDTTGKIWLFIDGDRNDSTHFGDGQPVNTPGQKISEPRAVTFAPNGDLLITENDNGYVRRVTDISRGPVMQSIEQQPGGGISFTWQSHREGSYRIDSSADGRAWSPLDAVAGGNGISTSYLHADPPAGTLLYRVVVD